MMSNYPHRVALVTGANRGIGLEVCRQLAQKNIQVILSSRNSAQGLSAQQQLKDEHLKVEYTQLDVTQQEGVDATYQFVTKIFGRLDILVNNAGALLDPPRHPPDFNDQASVSLFQSNLDVIRNSMETNTYGAIRLIQKFVPLMKKNGYGRIVNISSGMGQLAEMNGGWPGYRLSKTALNAITRIAADELQGTNILVNSICPGWVKTNMGGPDAELSVQEAATSIVWAATLEDGDPSGGFFRECNKIEW